MEGPLDPQHPGQDAGASQPEAQDGDLHALLERLLGQGDIRPSAPGAGDELWPDLAASPAADEVSTIVPAPDAPTSVAELPTAVEEPAAEAGVEPATAREWEPVVVDVPAATTNLDDIHAAIMASVSLELEPIDAPEPQPESDFELDLSRFLSVDPEPAAAADSEPPSIDALLEAALPNEALTIDEPIEPVAAELTLDDVTASVEPAAAGVDEPAEPAAAAFTLTPFEASEADATDPHQDADALWDATAPELGLDVAPLLDLDDIEDEEPAQTTAVVLPWRSLEPKPVEPSATTAHDLIEAALSGLHADLTSEPVEPLRTPDVAVSTAHVVFRLGSRSMAIPLAAVSEIARPPKVTRLPHVPAWVLGIANLRGDIVSMLDLEGFLSGKAGKSSHEQRMLALRPAGDEVRTAVLVDAVDGIQAFEDARISRVTRGYDAAVAVVNELDKATESWGVKVLRYEIKNITPPADVLAAMEKQMRAEREKRAVILTSEGQRDAAINNADGEKQQVIKASEARKQQQINEAEGQASAILAVASATAEGIRRVAETIRLDGGYEAVQLRVAEQYVHQFGQLAQKSTTLVLPATVSDVAGMIAMAMQVLNKKPAGGPLQPPPIHR